jgi:hypothetical protein
MNDGHGDVMGLVVGCDGHLLGSWVGRIERGKWSGLGGKRDKGGGGGGG